MAYNKDNQEDKEPLFDAVDTVVDMLCAFTDMVPGIIIKADAVCITTLQGYVTATDLANYLIRRDLSFRDACEVMTHVVRACDDLRCDLADLSVTQLRDICDLGDKANLIGDDVCTVLTLESSVTSRSRIGGTAPEQMK